MWVSPLYSISLPKNFLTSSKNQEGRHKIEAGRFVMSYDVITKLAND